MPRNVRNFWITADIDGRKSQIESGPIRRDGGIYLTIKMRDDGDVRNVLTVVGTAADDGALTLEIIDGGKVIHTIHTRR